MFLPTPTTDEVLRFQALYKEQYGTDLPTREALPLMTRLVQFYYLTGGHDARRQRTEREARRQQLGADAPRAAARQNSAGRGPSAP